MPNLKETIKETAAKLISNLNTRGKDVISRRFGLKTGKKETLESIGQSYGITRERVRQIEEASLKQIRETLASATDNKIKPFVALADNVLEQAGGVLPEEQFFNQIFGDKGIGAISSSLAFLLILGGKQKRNPEDENYNTFWAMSGQHANNFKIAVASFIKTLAKNNQPIAKDALADFSKKINPVSYLSISKEIGQNMFGQIGLTSWPEIKPRGVRDKSYLVLKKVGAPKHFREITQLIGVTFSDRKTNVQTVHNELIKDNRFVLVGRGLYGLSEWGYKAGTVKDVLVDLLKSSGKPMLRNDIVAKVLTHRLVKENTIILNLQDSKVFKKTDNGYTLREA